MPVRKPGQKVKCRGVRKQKKRVATAEDSDHEYHDIEINFKTTQESVDWLAQQKVLEDSKNKVSATSDK